ncbi:hypothetical protein L6452_35765 [Arctium lappa]|uniref:Uncharacterized protein n=1 Tax=Arctium lappa TaxID=4217 RepID=A0ACB8Y7C5_ARCLA|nr:hypothetical protein L6452_35765 [Arctium lappa]
MVIAFKSLVRDGEVDVCVLCFDLGTDLISSRETAFLGFRGVVGGFGVRGPEMRPRKFRPEVPPGSTQEFRIRESLWPGATGSHPEATQEMSRRGATRKPRSHPGVPHPGSIGDQEQTRYHPTGSNPGVAS